MIDLICLGLINALFIWGIHCLFSDGFIFHGFGKVLERTIGTTASTFIFTCPPCMSSFWGGMFFTLFAHTTLWLLLPYCICLCGFNYIIKEYLYP